MSPLKEEDLMPSEFVPVMTQTDIAQKAITIVEKLEAHARRALRKHPDYQPAKDLLVKRASEEVMLNALRIIASL